MKDISLVIKWNCLINISVSLCPQMGMITKWKSFFWEKSLSSKRS